MGKRVTTLEQMINAPFRRMKRRRPKMAERKVTNKEAAIRLVMKALGEAETGYTREEVQEILGAQTTQSRTDKINDEVQKQVARCKKLFAKYLEGRG